MEDGIFDSPTPQFHQDSNTSFLMEVRQKFQINYNNFGNARLAISDIYFGY